jgi:putative glutamine amidotransferase
MRPVIGLGTDHIVAERPFIKSYCAYAQAISAAGGLPLLLPPIAELAEELVAQIDGIVIPGGDDLPPELYGQRPHHRTEVACDERVSADLALLKAALARRIPVLGICYGAQLLNVALGGDIVQDLPELWDGATDHRDDVGGFGAEHCIRLDPDSQLAGIVGGYCVSVNSKHHQAIGRIGAGLRVVARAPDGVVEAIEHRELPFCLGLQWHPERHAVEEPRRAGGGRLFSALIEAARRQREEVQRRAA